MLCVYTLHVDCKKEMGKERDVLNGEKSLLRIIVKNGGLILILDVLKCGSKVVARQHAAGAFFYLASVEKYRQLIGKIPDAIPSLVELLRDETDRGKKNVLVTIFGLLLCPENHRRVFAAGLVPLLKQEQWQQWR
ncbi:unnamed protein product [Coffea canephora]|uniref:Uncharacterized protein n=1 Tax=Coffea canephora TaxID=49390 RepID=A0A068TMX0_COFCA|nr:unnamed protein product [Coffea canephora]